MASEGISVKAGSFDLGPTRRFARRFRQCQSCRKTLWRRQLPRSSERLIVVGMSLKILLEVHLKRGMLGTMSPLRGGQPERKVSSKLCRRLNWDWIAAGRLGTIPPSRQSIARQSSTIGPKISREYRTGTDRRGNAGNGLGPTSFDLKYAASELTKREHRISAWNIEGRQRQTIGEDGIEYGSSGQ